LYISMLHFGKRKLEEGFHVHELATHLKSSGFDWISENSTFLHYYFDKVFFEKNGVHFPHHSAFFYLRPECYMQLLEYENMIEARADSKKARREAKIAIIFAIISTLLTLIAVVVDILK